MKKNLLSLAVAAGVSGLTATSHASMYLNPEGTGEVLLFPYYNAQNGNETSMHIVNTTGDAKAVKVRFLEYVNSQEVLDFNLYLSEYDHFSFTIFKNPNGNGGAIVTRDNSCTVPALGDKNAPVPGSTTENADGSITRIQPFMGFAYEDDKYDGIERSLVGHVEVIEMGVLEGAAAAAATHLATGVPFKCATLVGYWTPGTPTASSSVGTWYTEEETLITSPSGGLYGLSNQLNAMDAAAFGIEPSAIADWAGAAGAGGANHSNPGELFPSLLNGDDDSLIPNSGSYYDLAWAEERDAVSSLFQSKSVMNDVMVNPDLNGLTDWVITFPTKRHYVNGTAAIQPFTDKYVYTSAPDNACEPITIYQWDREEAQTDPGGPQFSPKPDVDVDTNYLCYETNTIAVGSTTSALNASMSSATVKTAGVSLGFGYTEGWMRIDFDNAKHFMTPDTIGTTDNRASANSGTDTALKNIEGLPAIGFAAFKYVNGASSFGFVSDHKTDVTGSAIGD